MLTTIIARNRKIECIDSIIHVYIFESFHYFLSLSCHAYVRLPTGVTFGSPATLSRLSEAALLALN